MLKYKATCIKTPFGKPSKTIVEDCAIFGPIEGIAYPYSVYFNGRHVGNAKTLNGALKLAKHNFGLSYKLEQIN